MSTADKVKKAKKKPPGASALSFDMDDEGEAFAVKKSKKSRSHKHLKASSAAAPAVDTQVSSGVYTAEYLKQLRAETKFAPSSQAAEGPDDASEGLVPGVDDIRKARSERERARRLAEEQEGWGLAGPDGMNALEGAAFIPLDGSAASVSNGSGGGGAKYGESRLVREEQEADDEADGAALAFGGVEPRGRPKPEMATVQDLPEELGAADVDVKFGRRPGLGGAPTAVGASSSESLAEHAVLLADATRAEAVPERIDDAVRRLGAQLTALQHEQTETVRLLQESADECGQLEEALDAELQTHVFMQHAQAYVEDLLACLTEKSPRVEACEAALCDVLEGHHRASRAVQVQLALLEGQRAEASLGGSWRAPAPPPEAGLCTAAERAEATERLRRSDAALEAARGDAAAEEPAGWATSDEEGEAGLAAAIVGGAPPPAAAASSARALRQQAERVLAAADDVFADTAAEFCAVKQLVGRFSEWRATHPPSYRDAFLPTCLPTILAPFVRLQLLRWWPLEQGSLQNMEWHADVVDGWDAPGGAARGDAVEDDLGRRVLLAQLSCKLCLPRLKHVVVHSWRVRSHRQGVEVRHGVRELMGAAQQLRAASERLRGVDEDEAAALAAEEAEATAAVRELLLQVAMRLETSTAETCIPPCLAPDPPDAAGVAAARDAPARRAALRHMWRALKLMHTMNAWSELLATAALQGLGGTLLSAQLLPYLRVQLTSRPPRLELVTAACERAVAAVPPAWRCRDGSGMLPVCAAPLHLFVQELGGAVRAAGATPPSGAATGSGSLQERVAKLLDQLG